MRILTALLMKGKKMQTTNKSWLVYWFEEDNPEVNPSLVRMHVVSDDYHIHAHEAVRIASEDLAARNVHHSMLGAVALEACPLDGGGR